MPKLDLNLRSSCLSLPECRDCRHAPPHSAQISLFTNEAEEVLGVYLNSGACLPYTKSWVLFLVTTFKKKGGEGKRMLKPFTFSMNYIIHPMPKNHHHCQLVNMCCPGSFLGTNQSFKYRQVGRAPVQAIQLQPPRRDHGSPLLLSTTHRSISGCQGRLQVQSTSWSKQKFTNIVTLG